MLEFLPLFAILIAIIGAVWGHAIWLSSQFSKIYTEIDNKFEKLLNAITQKLDVHEHLDDKRFGSITDSLWELKLSNAVKEGKFNIKNKLDKDCQKNQ